MIALVVKLETRRFDLQASTNMNGRAGRSLSRLALTDLLLLWTRNAHLCLWSI